MIRVFVALIPPDEYKSALNSVIERFSEIFPTEIKWVDPAGIHLTLKFLGNIPNSDVPALSKCINYAIDRFSRGQFRLQLDRLGAFPNTSQPKILWAGLQGDMEKLQLLQESVESEIISAGFPAEQRSFNPHLTIGRIRRQSDKQSITAIGRVLESQNFSVQCDWVVSTIHIVESVLKPTGAEYTSLETQDLSLNHDN